MESISRCIYPAYSSAIPNKAIKVVNQINFDYIWKKKMHYIKRTEMTKEYKDGGLQAIDFDSINGTLKMNWLKSSLNNKSFWYHLSREIFKKLGGIDFLLKCDFNIHELPVKLSLFHQQVLLYWKLLYNHNSLRTTHQYGTIDILLLKTSRCITRSGWIKISGL